MWLLPHRSRIYTKTFSVENHSPAGALLLFKGKITNDLIAKFRDNYNVQGNYINEGGRISPQAIGTLLGASTGALGLSAALSGQLFMATANPATLMAIGNGVGSAIMGASGIIGQAPFIPLAGAIMPVVAPVLVFQMISTVMIVNQFKGIRDNLNRIQKEIDRILQRSEATFVGEIISAISKTDELDEQVSIGKHFSSDMTVRLCLLEDKVNPIFERYSFLYRGQSLDVATSPEDLRSKQHDAYLSIILGILDLRIDMLRLQ